METVLKIGDRVQYRKTYLHSIQQYTGPLPTARGAVTALHSLWAGMTEVSVAWDNDPAHELPSKVLEIRLELAD